MNKFLMVVAVAVRLVSCGGGGGGRPNFGDNEYPVTAVESSSASMKIAVIVTFVDEYIFPKVLHDMESLLQKQGYGKV